MGRMCGVAVRFSLALGAGLLLSSGVLTGCGKKDHPGAPAAQDAEAERQRFFAQVGGLLESGETGKACDAALARWRADAESARAAFRQIHGALLGKGDCAGALAWAKRLADPAAKMPADVLAETAAWRFDLALKTADAPAASAVVDELFDRLPPGERPALLEGYLDRCLAARNFDLFQASLEAFGGDSRLQGDAFKACFARLRLRAALERESWDAVPQALDACRLILPDNELRALLVQTFQRLRQLGQGALVETLAGAVYRAETEKTASRNYAARVWLDACLPARRDEIPPRLADLGKGGLSPIELGFLFERYFYELHDRPESLAKMCAIGEDILKRTDDADTLNAVSLKLLDGAFILDRLDKAVEMLEKGIPGKDAAWHALTLPKVKGHAALKAASECADPEEKKKRTLGAIESFKQFMEVYRTREDQDDEFDPTTGVAYSREWILGRNADRIAKLYGEVGDKAGCEAMRGEAKGFYETALKKAEGEPAALDLLRKEVEPYGLKTPGGAGDGGK